MPKKWLAPAKINLFLHINSRRADGYHQLQTIFQLIDVFDELSFAKSADGQIIRAKNPANISIEQDLTLRAARALKRVSNTKYGVEITLRKHIPIGAGLGGGSSDCATTLIALNQLWGLNLSTSQLMKIGLGLGADVPVFVAGNTAWAEGIGELLSPVKTSKVYFLLILVLMVN